MKVGLHVTSFSFVEAPASIAPLMTPAAVPQAIEMGRSQAAADADELRAFLG